MFELTVQIRLDKAKDQELLHAMREAGMDVVAIGFESPIPEELEAMDKHLKPEDMISLSRAFYQAGFLIHGMFIFGYLLEKEVPIRISARERVQHFRGSSNGPGSIRSRFCSGPHSRDKADPKAQQENRLFPRRASGGNTTTAIFLSSFPTNPDSGRDAKLDQDDYGAVLSFSAFVSSRAEDSFFPGRCPVFA